MAAKKSIYEDVPILMKPLPHKSSPDYQEQYDAAMAALMEFYGVEYDATFGMEEFLKEFLCLIIDAHVPAFKKNGRPQTRPTEWKARIILLHEIEKMKVKSDLQACSLLLKKWEKHPQLCPYKNKELSVPKLRGDLSLARKERAQGIALGEEYVWRYSAPVKMSIKRATKADKKAHPLS